VTTLKTLKPISSHVGILRCSVSWSVSKGRDTYGYNICRLDGPNGKRYRTCGGGYDMVGTVLADFMCDQFQIQLRELVLLNAERTEECGYSVSGYRKLPELYGLTVTPKGRVEVDGACGVSSVIKIFRAIGIDVQSTCGRRQLDGFLLFPRVDQEAAA